VPIFEVEHSDGMAESDHDLLIDLIAQVRALKEATAYGFDQVDKRFSKAERDLVEARESYPTNEDITKGMQDALTQSRDVARDEATQAYNRAAIEATSMFEKADVAGGELVRRIGDVERNVGEKIESVRAEHKAAETRLIEKIETTTAGKTIYVVVGTLGGVAGIGGVIALIARG